MMISSISPSMVYQSSPLVSNLRANGLTADKAILAAADVKGAIAKIGMVQRGPANKAAITAALQEQISADVASGKLSATDAAAVFKTFEAMDPAKQKGGAGAKAPPAAGDAPDLTKAEIDAQIAQLGVADSQRLAMLSKISDNFTAADTNSDGKVSRAEAEVYIQQTSDGSGGQPGQDGAGDPPPDGAGGPPPQGAGGKKGAGGPPPAGGGGGGGGGQSSTTKVVLSETATVIGNLQTTTILYTDGSSETKTAAVSADAMSSTYSKASVTDAAKTSANANGASSTGADKVQSYLSAITPGSLFDFLVH